MIDPGTSERWKRAGIIGLCVDVPNGVRQAPSCNLVGRLVLEQLLRMALSSVEARVHGWGELNRADFLITVSDLGLGLRIVREQIKAVGLSDAAVIGWYCDEQIWRSYFPRGAELNPRERAGEHVALIQEIAQEKT